MQSLAVGVHLSFWAASPNPNLNPNPILCTGEIKIKSGGGPPQSRTLARMPMAHEQRGASWSAPDLWRFGNGRRALPPRHRGEGVAVNFHFEAGLFCSNFWSAARCCGVVRYGSKSEGFLGICPLCASEYVFNAGASVATSGGGGLAAICLRYFCIVAASIGILR